MSCTNCFSGCTEITPDKCVRYTGPSIPSLEIDNGDPMLAVVSKITQYLTGTMDGTGVILDIQDDLCEVLETELSSLVTITLKDIVSAISKVLCVINSTVGGLTTFKNMLEAEYDDECLNLSPGYTLHDLIQAIITKLCDVDESFDALAASIDSTYLRKSEFNSYVSQYLSDNPPSQLIKDKLPPYVAVEYYGPLNVFDNTGAGTGIWDKIYLCNGNNGTPDKRGRVPVGAIVGVGGGAMDPTVDPGNGNPNYGLLSTQGSNTAVLTVQNLPAHNHPVTASFVGQEHQHFVVAAGRETNLSANNYVLKNYEQPSSDDDYDLHGTRTPANLGLTSKATPGGTVTVQVQNAGGGLPHNNIQPSLACYYIIHLP